MKTRLWVSDQIAIVVPLTHNLATLIMLEKLQQNLSSDSRWPMYLIHTVRNVSVWVNNNHAERLDFLIGNNFLKILKLSHVLPTNATHRIILPPKTVKWSSHHVHLNLPPAVKSVFASVLTLKLSL